jgi:glycosyltransferase involved in cell wall biosynthesis
MEKVASERSGFERYIDVARRRVSERYNWETVTDQYEDLFYALTR